MNTRRWFFGALLLLLSVPLSAASARGLSVEVATDRGHDAVYRTGDPIVIETRTSEDAHLLVYEIDAEGYVHLLYPDRHSDSWVEGDRTYYLPDDDSEYELVAKGPTGQGYIVAIASEYRFRDLPWYLRPYDAQAEEMGYDGDPDEDSGVTAEGRIVGDPFVAMERIRRAVLDEPEDEESFATAYTGYFIGHEVRYPRYLCYDCHRPGYWSWWSGFDPYYTRCNVFDFRVNWGWSWGHSYWTGHVPYYVFVYRTDCPPRYRLYNSRGVRHSSWDGWPRWRTLWGGPLRRYKTDPPPRTAFDPSQRWPKDRTPPGYLAGGGRQFRGGIARDPRVRDLGDRGAGIREPRDAAARERGREIRARMKTARAGIRDPRQTIAGDRERRDRGDRPEVRQKGGEQGRAREVREGRGDPGRRETRQFRNDPPPRETRDWRSEQGRREYRVPREDRGQRDDRGNRERRDGGERKSGERHRESRSWMQWTPRPFDTPRAAVVPSSPPAFDQPPPPAYEMPRPVEPRPVSVDIPQASAPPPAPPREVARPPVNPEVFRQPMPQAVRRVERGRRE
jgi:hypothetical protein